MKIVIVKENNESTYFVQMPEYPGCFTEGKTLEECIQNITEVKELWCESSIEHGLTLPDSKDFYTLVKNRIKQEIKLHLRYKDSLENDEIYYRIKNDLKTLDESFAILDDLISKYEIDTHSL